MNNPLHHHARALLSVAPCGTDQGVGLLYYRLSRPISAAPEKTLTASFTEKEYKALIKSIAEHKKLLTNKKLHTLISNEAYQMDLQKLQAILGELLEKLKSARE